MNAWIDCMEEFALENSSLNLKIIGIQELKISSPDICNALIECVAFINFRAFELKSEYLIGLSYVTN